jgi:hypothetical protein
MWKKYHDIAQRQYEAGKLKTVAMHANKALDFAKKENNLEQIAMTYRLLAILSMDQFAPDADDHLQRAIDATIAASGPNAFDLISLYRTLAAFLGSRERFEESAEALQKAENVARELGDDKELMDVLDVSSDFLLEREMPEKAELKFLEAVSLTKKIYGQYSDAVAEQLDYYLDVLKALGRTDDIKEYEGWNFIQHSQDPDAPFVMDRPSVAEIIASTQEKMKDKEVDESIALMRAAVDELRKEAEATVAKFPAWDPFQEYRTFIAYGAYRWACAAVGELLRIKGMNENDKDLIREAKEQLVKVYDESHGTQGHEQLVFALLDLKEEGYLDDIDVLIAHAHDTVVTMYTKALVAFLREGSTTASRRAIKDAVEFNPAVPFVIMEAAKGNQFEAKDEAGEEAEAYVRFSMDHWVETPGAIEFMLGEFTQHMRALARTLDKDQLMKMLSAAGMQQ